jgi:pimeloyl-ACP methyl ester carboxylesterase
VASLPPGFKEDLFSADNIPIHYVSGPRNGLPLLLLHGTARDWNSFSAILPQLSSRFQIFIPDLRGHGGSGRVPGGYRISQYAADISSFVRNLVPAGPAVFGHSLGGIVALTVAADYPLSAVIVGDSMLSAENLASGMYHSLFQQLRDLLILGGSQEQIARGIGKIQLQLPGIDEPVAIAELAGNTEAGIREWARSAMCTDPDVLSMAVSGSTYENWTAQQVLPRVTCPVLLLQGNPELDALLTDSDVALAKKLLPRAEHIKFPLLGHALFMQRPEPVLKATLGFLERQMIKAPVLRR